MSKEDTDKVINMFAEALANISPGQLPKETSEYWKPEKIQPVEGDRLPMQLTVLKALVGGSEPNVMSRQNLWSWDLGLKISFRSVLLCVIVFVLC